METTPERRKENFRVNVNKGMLKSSTSISRVGLYEYINKNTQTATRTDVDTPYVVLKASIPSMTLLNKLEKSQWEKANLHAKIKSTSRTCMWVNQGKQSGKSFKNSVRRKTK